MIHYYSNGMTLGQLIIELLLFKKEVPVYYDFVNFCPNKIHSYRGSYDQLALGYSQNNPLTIEELVKLLQKAIGNSFQGYKGGSYLMTKHTQLWVSNHDEASKTAIVAVRSNDEHVFIITENMP